MALVLPGTVADPSGMIAVTPDGKILQQGSPTTYNPLDAGSTYKIYRAPNGRLFRSYNPGIHGRPAKAPYGTSGMSGMSFTQPASSFKWEWSPAEDYKVWGDAAKVMTAQKTAAAKKAGGAKGVAAPTGAAGATGSAVGKGAAAVAGGAVAGGATTGGGGFSYDKYLAANPALQGTLEQIRLQRIAQGAQLVGGEQQLFGRLGEAPDLSQPQYANLPPELKAALANVVNSPDLQAAISAGNQAGTSALARLQHTYDVTQSGDVGSLAARNMLHSGALGQHLNEDLHNYTVGQYDARLGAADALGALQQTYLTGQQTNADNAYKALTDAQTNAGQLTSQGMLGATGYTTPGTKPAAASPHVPAVATGPVKNPYLVTQPPKPKVAAPFKPPSLGFKAAI